MRYLNLFVTVTASFLLCSCFEQKYYALEVSRVDVVPSGDISEVKKAMPEEKEAESSAAQSPFTSVTPSPNDFPLPAEGLMEVTEKIYGLLKDDAPATPEEMTVYEESLPEVLADHRFQMVPIPGGVLDLGSPESEVNRGEDEVLVEGVEIQPFWMASTETSWELYRLFMENGDSRNKDGSINYDSDIYTSEAPQFVGTELPTVISQPTPPFMAMHFELGEGGYNAEYPAISMTQHAASKFCEWLTAHTGHYYRLPTEAEWEYACRAGTTTAYSFGDDATLLDDYAWHEGNSDYTYQPLGKKKPNPWGLYDMHGNVSEWCLDFYVAQRPRDGGLNPLPLSKSRYPRVTKGGHWEAKAEMLRSAARFPSEPVWKMQDPQIPKSIWYHTDAVFIGFRVVRPFLKPTVEEMHLLWNTGPGELDY